MSRKSAAVLDVRSAEVTVAVGQRGVNNTFVIQGMHTQPYKGYAEAEFFDVRDLQEAIFTAFDTVEESCGARIRELYIGVPGEFLQVRTQRCFMRFENKRKVTGTDVKALMETQPEENFGPYTVIRKTEAYYVLSDRRRTVDPVGMVSNSLEGLFSYYLADNRFLDILENLLSEYGIRKWEFMPTSLAEALYLVPQAAREAGAVLLDVDKISMTFSFIEGNAAVWQHSCSAGGGHVIGQVYFEEDTDVPFYVVEAMVGKINLASMDEENIDVEYADRYDLYSVPMAFLKGCVQDGLDILCGVIVQCFEMSGDPGLNYRPLLLTGGGITEIRGVREYLSMRLGREVDILAPDQPYYGKAAQSSYLSLLDMALERKRKKSFIYKLFHGNGG